MKPYSKPITVMDLAMHRGAQEIDGGINASEFWRVGLDIIGGCRRCGASIAAYNAHPTKSGFWACSDCVGDDGWDSVEEANRDVFHRHLTRWLEDSVQAHEITSPDAGNYRTWIIAQHEKLGLSWEIDVTYDWRGHEQCYDVEAISRFVGPVDVGTHTDDWEVARDWSLWIIEAAYYASEEGFATDWPGRCYGTVC